MLWRIHPSSQAVIRRPEHKPYKHCVSCPSPGGGYVSSNTLLGRAHPNWCQKPGSVHAALRRTRPLPKELLCCRQGKIITHTSETAASAVSCRQTTGLISGCACQWNLLRGQHRESTLYLKLLHLWQISGLTQVKFEVAPDWSTYTTGVKPCPKQAKRATTDAWNEGRSG